MSDRVESEVLHPEDCPTTEIHDENPFRDQVVDMASDGRSWLHIYEQLEECLDAVDEKAREEV